METFLSQVNCLESWVVKNIQNFFSIPWRTCVRVSQSDPSRQVHLWALVIGVCLKELLLLFCCAEDGVLLGKCSNNRNASPVRFPPPIPAKYSFSKGNAFLGQSAELSTSLDAATF